ncbi:MAG: hypothetical protein ACE5EA_07445 [Nitrospirota bacterium]
MDKEIEHDGSSRQLIDARPLNNGRCPFCRYRIEIWEDDKSVIIKTKIIRLDMKREVAYLKCSKCRQWVMLNLRVIPDSKRLSYDSQIDSKKGTEKGLKGEKDTQ